MTEVKMALQNRTLVSKFNGRKTDERRNSISNIVTIDITANDLNKAGKEKPKAKDTARWSSVTNLEIHVNQKKRKLGAAGFETDAYTKTEESITYVISETHQDLKRYSAELVKRVSENPNTKREIKELISKIEKVVEVLSRKSIVDWMERHRFLPVPKLTVDQDIQTETFMKAEVTQTTWTEGSSQESLASKIEKSLDIGDTFQELGAFIDAAWPQEVYKCTSVEHKSLSENDFSSDMCILVDPSKLKQRTPPALKQNNHSDTYAIKSPQLSVRFTVISPVF